VRTDELVEALDAYFRVPDVRTDDWAPIFETLYPEPYWRDYAEPGYEGRWNGLMVRGSEEVASAATCVFPSDEIVAGLEPGTFLFAEHPIDLAKGDVFTPLARDTFELLHERAVSFYNAHAPLDQHPEVSPSRLIAGAIGIEDTEEYFPIAPEIPGGAAVIGEVNSSVEQVAERLQAFLGPEIPVVIAARAGHRAGRVAVVAGGGAQSEILEESLARGCETYVTGNAISPCPIPDVQASIAAFRALASEAGVSVVDGTHYGTEKPPQVAMADWFRAQGVSADFVPGRPERE
jgi:putative NIF3 family GTP cyclohydrolase 1 type 2